MTNSHGKIDLIKLCLIVQGSFNLLQMMLCTLSTCVSACWEDRKGISLSVSFYNILLILFLFGWTIAGSVWVWDSLVDWPNDHYLCDDAVFVSAVVCVSLYYVKILLVCCCCAYSIWQLCNSDDLYELK